MLKDKYTTSELKAASPEKEKGKIELSEDNYILIITTDAKTLAIDQLRLAVLHG